MNKVRGLAILNVISFISHLVVTYLTQTKSINTKDVGEISDLYRTLVTPAGFTFAIWGIIYTYLSIFCVYHIVMAYKRNKDNGANKDTHRIGYLFFVNNFATAAWLIAWTHEQLLLSVLLILLQLSTLIFIHRRLHIHSRLRNPGAKISTELPLSLYFGWISLATIANISSWLKASGWNAWGIAESYWAGVMIFIATIIGVLMILRRRNILFGLVFMWGFYGIISALDARDMTEYTLVSSIAWGGIIIMGLCVVIQIAKGIAYQKPLHQENPGETTQ